MHEYKDSFSRETEDERPATNEQNVQEHLAPIVATTPNRAGGGFISMVLHELRTPLNSLDGVVDLLMRGDLGELTEQQHLYLGYAKEAVGQLTSVVEDILLVMRSDSGEFEIRPEGMDFRAL